MALSATAATAAAAAPLPAQKFTVRSGKVGIRTYLGPTKLGAIDEALTSPEGRIFEYSRDGNLLAIGTTTEIIIRRVTTGEVQARISRRGVEHISFSPQGNYLLTWEHMPKDLPEDEKKVYGNLNVWSTKTGEHIHRFIQKAFLRENWPSLRWSDDELICGRMVSNEVQFYAGKIGQVARILKLPNVSAFSISPGGPPYKIAAFAGESKGMPGMVRIYKYPEVAQHVAHKSFFKAQNVDLMWNAQGTALLIGAHTDVDRSGKSYYGEDSLYYMTTEGKVENVSLPKEGPIHSTSWSPTGKEFMVIYGFMPAQATLFGVDCKPKCDFGAAPRNTINWDPFGRIVCISGFGNLQGDMDFWDVRKLKKVGTATAHCSAHFEWAPDGIHVITAVLSPRIRVDNGYKIWRCDGTLLHQEAVDELLKVAWRPSLTGIFPEPRPPPPLGASTKEQPSSPSTAAAAPTATAAPAAPAAPAKYRHPNFTGADVKVREQSTGPVKYSAKAVPKKDLPAGAVFVSKTSNKNKKKRQNKKKTENGGEPAPEAETGATEAVDTESTGGGDVEKRIKAITKKLRQIAQLKEQAAAGKVLDAAQKEKLQAESQLAEQLKQLQVKQ